MSAPVPGDDVAAATARLAARRTPIVSTTGPWRDLVFRLGAAGQVQVSRLASGGPGRAPYGYPVVRGRLQPAPSGGVLLVGTARESRINVAVSVMNWVLTLGMLALGLSALPPDAYGPERAAVLGTGFGAAAVFALIGLLIGWARRRFSRDVDDLLADLAQLPPADGSPAAS
ncbi:hypothetical protein [Blastococcus sp. TF02-09]|uniref:hypothetical protein n=1 Tax=Blastococcus sp. TF02-09 TaxID=2250576 RepID=UPI0011BDC3A2|nr:hypothetical protein [Blastococcus sp. TF02-9]